MTEGQDALPPLAEMVSDEDVSEAVETFLHSGGSHQDAMRAVLEAYGRRLVARIGGTGQ